MRSFGWPGRGVSSRYSCRRRPSRERRAPWSAGRSRTGSTPLCRQAHSGSAGRQPWDFRPRAPRAAQTTNTTMNATGKSTSGFQPLTVIYLPRSACKSVAQTLRQRPRGENAVRPFCGQRVCEPLAAAAGMAFQGERSCSPPVVGDRKKPLESLDSRGFPLCAEGDLNPHPLSRTSTSS